MDNDTNVMPVELANILNMFPFTEYDRITYGEDGNVLVEWHMDGSYFEIEYNNGHIEIMTKTGDEVTHWEII